MDVPSIPLETLAGGMAASGVAAGLALLWGIAFASLGGARQTDDGRRSRAPWPLAGAALAMGLAWWAAGACSLAAVLGGTIAQLPGWVVVLSLMAAVLAAGGAIAGARDGRPGLLIASIAGCAFAALLMPLLWAQHSGVKATPALLVAMLGASLLAQGALIWPLARRQPGRRGEATPVRAGFAALHAVAALAPVLVLGTADEATRAAAWPQAELVLAAFAGLLGAMTLKAADLEGRLRRRHRRLRARLRAASAHRVRKPLSDPLTGLPNRLGFEALLGQASAQAEARGNRVALMFIGLDGFKNVNDSYGHAVGDTVLREMATRLASEARQLVAPPRIAAQTLSRVGGDEFVLMIEGQVERRELAHIAQRLLSRVAQPLACEQREVALSASMGLACFPDDGGAPKLMSHADSAMQAAKAAGGATYSFFEAHMHDDAHERMELLRDLRQAIEANQLELFYQPKIDAGSGQVTAAEALLRWHHPTRGIVNPGVFIPIAERYGLVGALGNWVIEDACRQAGVWRERGLKMRVAINLSAYQMRQDDLVERLCRALARHKVEPSRLTCEITESVAMEDTQVTQRTFARLGKAGIHLSIDDFGTGYSSLSYLRQLPASELKVDRSFVMDLEASADARAIVDAVLKLAHAIGLKVVAEGVETQRQRDILLELGCDEFQGFLFARPMSARALLLWAVDDRPARQAFRDSLFADTQGPGSSPMPSHFDPVQVSDRISLE
jgi:diguanylate cyclase (GGDEF)-like protein